MPDTNVRGMRVAIGLGSNLGDRVGHLRLGLEAVAAHVEGLRVSRVYETGPRYYEPQGLFLNACCVGWTRLTPRQMLSELQDAERRSGRRRGGPRFGPRELDLDLLLYGSLTLESDQLVLPHPRLRERAFVLVPLAEIAADWEVPATPGHAAATVADLAAAVTPAKVKRTEIDL
jgi:2-amino-4-hydroxy-6-hydroxymethyldihydropteridine diphosphokinase